MRVIVGVYGLLCLLAGSVYAARDDIATDGEIIADSGFRPQANGFRFANWGGREHPEGRLEAEDVRYMFGDRVCASQDNDECEPTPAAQLWIEQMNQIMQGGHCEGMAALSAAFFTGYEDIGEYGARTAYALKPAAEVLHMISAYFTLQVVEPVASEADDSLAWPLSDIVELLRGNLGKGRDEYYTLGIYGGDGGHAVTPYAIEDLGEGQYRIHVYDNNYPGADKYVEVDTTSDHWNYAVGALNPEDDVEPWEGNSGSMDVTSLTARMGDLECPFCGAEEAESTDDGAEDQAEEAEDSGDDAEDTSADEEDQGEEAEDGEDETEVATGGPPSIVEKVQASARGGLRRGLRGQSPTASPRSRGPASLFAFVAGQCERVHVQAGGRSLGLENGKLVSQIQGGHMRRLRGSRGCLVSLPAQGDYQFSLRGAAERVTTGVTFVAPGRVFKISNLDQAPQQVDKFRIAASAIHYTAGTAKAPVFTLATDNPHGEDALYTINDAATELGKSLSLRLDRKTARLSFATEGDTAPAMKIQAVLSGLKGRREFSFDQVKQATKGWGTLSVDPDSGLKLKLHSEGKNPFAGVWSKQE